MFQNVQGLSDLLWCLIHGTCRTDHDGYIAPGYAHDFSSPPEALQYGELGL